MTRLLGAFAVVVVGLAVVAAAGPALTKLAHAAWPLVLVVGVVIALVRVVWFFTSRW